MRTRSLFFVCLFSGCLLFSLPALAKNNHTAGFGGTFRFASFTTLSLMSSNAPGGFTPSGSLDFRTWTDKKVFGFGLHLGMNVAATGSRPIYGVAPGLSLDFGLLRHGPVLPYLGVSLRVLVASTGGSTIVLFELQPRFGVEMFLFLKRKVSLFVEIGVPISIAPGAAGALVEFGSLALGFRYYI